MARFGKEFHHFAEERRRKIVHAVVAGVLEDGERDAFTGAGHPAYQNELH